MSVRYIYEVRCVDKERPVRETRKNYANVTGVSFLGEPETSEERGEATGRFSMFSTYSADVVALHKQLCDDPFVSEWSARAPGELDATVVTNFEYPPAEPKRGRGRPRREEAGTMETFTVRLTPAQVAKIAAAGNGSVYRGLKLAVSAFVGEPPAASPLLSNPAR